jgi:hypothetical protein
MATYYWVGGSGSWTPSITANWATSSGGAGGAGYPTTADDVIFDQAGPYTVTVFNIFNANPSCKSLTVTGANVTFSCTSSPYAPRIVVAGAFVVAATTVFVSVTQALIIYLQSPSSNTALTLNGATFGSTTFAIDCPATFNNGYLLGSNLIAPNVTISVDQGSFDTGGYQVTVFGIYALSTLTTPSISLQSSVITLSGNFDWRNTNGTFSAGTSTLIVEGTVITASGRALYNLTLDAGPVQTINFSSVRNLTLSNPGAGGSMAYVSVASNFTVTNALTLSGGGYASSRTYLYSSQEGTQRTITVNGSFVFEDVDFTDIVAAGSAGTWSGTRLGDAKNNTNITFPAGVNKYWNKPAGGYTSDSNAWATTSGGTPAATVFPLPQDTAVFEATGLNSGATVVLSTRYRYGTIDMSARTSNTMTLSLTSSLTKYTILGNWINGSGTTITGASLYISFEGRTTQTLTSAGRAFPSSATLYIGDTLITGTTLRLLDDLPGSVEIYSAAATLDLNGRTCNANAFKGYYGSTLIFNGGTLQLAGVGTPFNASIGGAAFTTVEGTGPGTIRLTGATSKTFDGGNGNVFNCTLDITGGGSTYATSINGSNTFTTITNSVSPVRVFFQQNNTNEFTNFNLAGTPGNLVTIGSSTSTRTTLSKAIGVVSGNYLSISNTNATGGAVWYAVNSTDGGNNLGWQFAASDSGMLLWF